MNSHKKASFFMFLLLFHIAFISHSLILTIARIFPSIAMPKNSTFLQMIGSVIFFAIPVLIYAIIKKLPLNKILMLKPISLKNFFIIVFLSLFMQPFLQLISALTSLFAENELTDALNSFYQAPFWQVFLAVAIFPAILEEVIFRGVFSKEYEDCPFWFGVIFSGLFFGLMHLTITQLFYATIAGIILSILVKVTNSIWSSILAHFVLNGTQITISYFLVNQNPSLINESASLILEEPSGKMLLVIS
ncbi:MAG: CPBP family intramembrane metalloprotease, partial [Eubacteriales bacterium]|nr:CPBP family intramembrane metalloprotease [Eubacteriales bacterium]